MNADASATLARRCKDCGDPVIWTKDKEGKPLALNANCDRRYVMNYQRAEQVATYIAHSETCRQLKLEDK